MHSLRGWKMENPILDLFSPTVLMAIGVLLIAFESLFLSFVLFWFGIAFLIVAFLSLFNLFHDGLSQLSSVAFISILLLFSLRSKAVKLFLKPKDEENNDTFLNQRGVGVIKEGKVYYKATYWNIGYEGEESFEENEKVIILSAFKNVAHIRKIEKGK